MDWYRRCFFMAGKASKFDSVGIIPRVSNIEKGLRYSCHINKQY